MKSENESRI